MPKKKPNLGNTQCSVCLNIFPVYGELPQDVECPRCGTKMKLEWRTAQEPESPTQGSETVET